MFETFEHGADIGIRGKGKSLEEAFANGAKALFSLMFELSSVRPERQIEISCSAPDLDMLFLTWLNRLIALADVDNLALSEFDVTINGLELKAKAKGEPIDPERHDPGVEVKGATFTMLTVRKENGNFIAQCVVDV